MTQTNDKFNEAFIEKAKTLCAEGIGENALASLFGVPANTIESWKKKSPAFGEAINRGKAIADFQVVQSLFRLCNGYTYVNNKVMRSNRGCEIVQYQEKVQPDIAAIKFWLTNRMPETWEILRRQMMEHESSDKEIIVCLPQGEME